MPPIPKGGLVAVTGAAGFIGSWAVKLLLDKGYSVRACVRDANDGEKTDFFKAMPGYASGRLTIHSANLDTSGCFDAIFKGCHGVLHISHVSDYSDEAYVKRVCDHIVSSVNQSNSVGRVIVTSSIAGVLAEMDLQEMVRRPVLYEDRYPDELNPKRTFKKNGYSVGKVYAQRAFADAAEKSGFWDSVTVCPADNVGPILSPHQKNMGPWQSLIALMLRGKTIKAYPGFESFRPWMIVDVRDDAEAHIRMLESVHVRNGERYIAWSTDTVPPEKVCADIDRLLPSLGHEMPSVVVEYSERSKANETALRRIWNGADLRNDRVRAVTGMTFRHWDESLRDCVESLLTVAKVQPKLRSGFTSKL